MQVATLELCRTLFEVSGWDDTHLIWLVDPNNDEYHREPGLGVRTVRKSEIFEEYAAYDLGYLMRRLPQGATLSKFKPGQNYTAPYGCRMNFGGDRSNRELALKLNKLADTPENATARLCIELFKAGVLKREEK